MADRVLFHLADGTSHTATTEYRLVGGGTYSFTCDGADSGIWQFNDDNGSGWTSFTSGSGLNFTADIPQSGRVRLSLAGSGPTLAGFVMK